MAILDSNYVHDEHYGLAATWLRWEISRHLNVIETSPGAADILLCTVSSQQGVARLRSELRKAKNKHAKVVLGGGAAYAPAVFDPYINVACVGEGASFVRKLFNDGYEAVLELPEAWIPGDTREVIPNGDFPWELPPLNNTDGTVRVFPSRGCNHRCLFCQTGWQADGSINPNRDDIIAAMVMLHKAGRRVELISNEAYDDHIPLTGQHVSMRVENVKKIIPITRAQAASVRMGVEGISERLRLAVGKPVTNDDLLTVTFSLLGNGVGVKWFFVNGLYNEIASDYDDLRYLTTQLKKLSKGTVMMNFHSFIPQPATPLGVLPLVDNYWETFDEFRRWFFSGPGFTRRAQIVSPNRYASRLARAMESMAATEEELRRGWYEHINPNWRVRYLATSEQLRKYARIYTERTAV